jgi:hypothetical protein
MRATKEMDMTDVALCQLCGEPMPKGEEMFNYHGSSGPCPKPPRDAPDPAPVAPPEQCVAEAYGEPHCIGECREPRDCVAKPKRPDLADRLVDGFFRGLWVMPLAAAGGIWWWLS